MRLCASVFITVLFVVGCGDNNPGGPDTPPRPACSDGVDNDKDGQVDFPEDSSCEGPAGASESSPTPASCNDKRDNDGDGKVDFPDDPGCLVPQSDAEDDDCPAGLGCPECADGVDNDGNGQADFPGDLGCNSAGDRLEVDDDPAACGGNLRIELPAPSGTNVGTLETTSTSTLTSPCGGGGGAPAIAYRLHLTQPHVIIASTDNSVTVLDTVLDLRSAMCDDPTAHVACHDDVSASDRQSKLVRAVPAGTYYLIVQSSSPTETGLFVLTLELQPGQGDACTTNADCTEGLVCRTPIGGTAKQCLPPVCSDTVDDDADGKIDYPDDPGCTSPTDDTEDDVCATAPTDPACPQCGNGLDDDGDGQIDYPDDLACTAASATKESCAQAEPVIVATTPLVTGSTVGATNDFRPPPGTYNNHACSTSATTTHSAPDVAIQLDVPALSSWSLKLNPVSFNSSHVLLDASCTGMPIDCHDSPTGMTLPSTPAGRYYLVVDGYSTASGTFTLNISGTIQNGESCESPLAQSGALVCGVGQVCKGPAGGRTCRPTECNDGVDNNGDVRFDFPADPGCTNISDDGEDTVCPGASCPVCADGLDNDNDNQIDYPTDTGCLAASSLSEGCRETEPILAITAPTTTGTLVGATTDDHNPTCVTTSHPDRIYTLDLPVALQSLVIDTEGSVVNTVLSFMDRACGEPSIACDNDGGDVPTTSSRIIRGFVPAGLYTIAVDASTTPLDTYVLNVHGTIPAGGSCEGALYQAGVLSCPVGFDCNGTPGARKCTASQCLDGLDNNSDGRVDFPDDPGCDSASDNTENTVCPGMVCPACADGLDNDGDGDIDYPDDDGCDAASGRREGCADSDPIGAITAPITTGTLVGATDDHDPLCVTTNGTDLMFTLDVPKLRSLTIDTNGSTVDTALSLMNSACEEPALACDDDGGDGTGDSRIIRNFVPAGLYTIAVDADTTVPNTFVLNVAGTIAPGDSCDHSLVAAGVLTCSTGFVCSGPAGSRTCTPAQCLDGVDNNGDGLFDFPDDPGCDSFSDDSEDTVCPGPACPDCSDGADNDGDGATDYPDDPSCFAASSTNEACTQSEPVGHITQMVTTGDTLVHVNDYTPTCGLTTHTAPDLAYQLDLPPMATLRLARTGFSGGATALLDATCGGPSLACGTTDPVALTNLAAGTYYVVIDGTGTSAGAWTLTTTGTVAPGGSCEGGLFQSGAFTCTRGYRCGGTAGMRTCTQAQCFDGIDNNGDGTVDYPFDPGCTTPSDDTETTVCPGPDCPVCSNMLDDDADMQADFPADFGCGGAGATTEQLCPTETDPVAAITMPQTTGTLAAPLTGNYGQSCQATPTTTTGVDRAYLLQLPVPVATLSLDTLGSAITDTLLSVWDAGCTEEIACDDDSAPDTTSANNRSVIVLNNVAAGNYAIQVDRIGTGTTTFTLNIKGTVAPGTVCTSPLFTAGVLVCPTGTTCAGTCQ